MRDGTKTRGEQNGRAKLTERQVIKLREYRKQGWTLSQLSARFGIARTTAGQIALGHRWPHVKEAA